MYVPHVKSIDVEHMRHNERYFRTALSLYENMGILGIMQFNKDIDVDIIMVFFATVHLGTDEAWTLQWMTNGRLLFAPWKSFMDLLHTKDKGLKTPLGFRPHHEYLATHKQAMYKFSTEKISSTTRKSTWVLEPFLDIMHRIFRATLFPRVGNVHQVHSYLVDMLLFCEKHKFKS
ncbi:putative atp-dependent rna helicase ddx11 [Hordeum vulgare]|nr:putative atp-dependent rna helicase ddx11 [Hordeum vulgare]